MNRSTALLNGAILWATTLIIGSWLLASGVGGTFGIAASNAGEVINQAQQGGANLPNRAPNITAQQARDIAGNAARVGWSCVWFITGFSGVDGWCIYRNSQSESYLSIKD